MKHTFALPLVILACCLPTAGALAQADNSDARRISDLEQDVQELKEKVGQMNMQMEQVQRDNEALRAQLKTGAGATAPGGVTSAQLDAQLANLRAEVVRAQAAQKNEIIDEMGRQIERLAQQTQQASQTTPVAQAPAPAVAEPAAAPSSSPSSGFSDNFPKTGVSYTVQKGDSLTKIARRFNATLEDIRNANHISKQEAIRVGQKLFIPQRNAAPASSAK